MDVALLVARLVLAVVFAVAGGAKLLDRPGSRRAAADFGVPAALVPLVALALPVAELVVAAALLPAASAVWAAVAAASLLLVFCVAIGVSILRGRAPDCHCFGQLHSEPAGWRTLARNALLGVVAVFVLGAGWGDPGPSAFAWIADLDGLEALAVGALATAVAAAGATAWLAMHLLRANRRLVLRLDGLEERLAHGGFHAAPEEEPEAGLPVGTPAPDFSLPDVHGEQVTLLGLLDRGRPLLLVFTDPGCGPCETLMPDVARWQREYAEELTVGVVSAGACIDNRAKAEEHGLESVLCDEGREVYQAYEGDGTPSAVVVDATGSVASLLWPGPEGVRRLVDQTLERTAEEGLPVGTPVPDVSLPHLDGGHVELTSFRGGETVFLFWDPDCGFCRNLHSQVRAWEDEPPAAAPRLVVIAAGEADAIRREGFRSPVLLDERRQALEAFRALSTPSAVLVDADGRVAWPIAVGSKHILRLIRSGPARSFDGYAVVDERA